MKNKTDGDENSKSGSESFLFSLYQKFKNHGDDAGGKTKTVEAEVTASPPKELPKSEAAAARSDRQNSITLLALQQMCDDWAEEQGLSTREPCVESFLSDSVVVCKEVEDLLESLNGEAQSVLKAIKMTADIQLRPKVNGRVLIYVSKDAMQAWGFVFPPLLGGDPVKREAVLSAMEVMKVKSGIHEDAVSSLTGESKCMRLVCVASGTPSENGVDGRIEEIIPHTVGTPYMESSTDVVDYRNLNWIVHVQENELICRVIPPTTGKPGVSVLGKEIPCTSGKKLKLPIGKNTQLSEDGTTITAKTEGQIFYENGQYRVTDVIQINGDVDLSTGNIDVKGNVFVQGSVRDGFWVKATGDVNIAGSVGAGTVQAGGNLFVRSGINGGEQGRLQAGGDVKCRYIESAEVHAEGNVYADSIANSTVVCGGEVVAESGHGAIIGGTITAMKAIQAREVGNERGLVTKLILERTPEFIAQKAKVSKEYKEVCEQVGTAQAQLKMLERGDDPEILKAVKDIHFRLSIFLVKQGKLEKQMKEIDDREDKLSMAQMKIAKLYPTVAARINGVSRICISQESHCLIFQSDSTLEFGHFD